MCTSITLVRTMGAVNNNELGLASQMSKQSFMGGSTFCLYGTKENGTNQPTLVGNDGVFSRVSAKYNSSRG